MTLAIVPYFASAHICVISTCDNSTPGTASHHHQCIVSAKLIAALTNRIAAAIHNTPPSGVSFACNCGSSSQPNALAEPRM